MQKSIETICKDAIGVQSFDSAHLMNNSEKFHILNTCFKELKHSVPNSLLYKMKNLGKEKYIIYILKL